MRIVVTGASGHIGNCLVRALTEKGALVKVLVHDFENNLPGLKVEMVKGSITDPATLERLCEGAEVVFHLAARISIDNREPGSVYAVNVLGTGNMIRASVAAGVRRFIHFSSVEAIRTDPEGQEMDETRALVDSTKNIYGFTKAESEKLVMRAAKDGLDALVISPTAVIGPYDYHPSFLGRALVKMYTNSLPFLVSGGYDWIDVRDVVSAAIRSIETGRKGEKYLLGGNYCSIEELSRIISTLSGHKPANWFVPVSLARMAAPFFSLYADLARTKPLYTGQSLDLLANPPKSLNCSKAREHLDHTPRPLEQTLRDTFEWFRQNKYLM